MAKASGSYTDATLRIQRSSNFDYQQSLLLVSDFYEKQQDPKASEMLATLLDLPRGVITCLGVVFSHLKELKLEAVLNLAVFLRPFTSLNSMLLSSQTLENLEILPNQSDGSERGSLFWLLNQTHTTFGGRLLKRWISNPLIDPRAIQERLEAVEELSNGDAPSISLVRQLLSSGLPDLERGLCRIYYKKCSTAEFYNIMKAFDKFV
jgi:DNA mismatch repair protein MSH3